MKEIEKFKDALLFEIQKAFYDERGKGARYRLTTIGVSFIEDKISNNLDDIEQIKKYLIENNLVTDMECFEDEITFKIKVKDCCLKNTRDYFTSLNMQPLGCPIANIIMNAIELKSGLSPELLPIKCDGNYCECVMAKMATSEVVKE